MNHDIEKALDNLEKRAQDIQHYMNIMSKVKTVNVADDQDFQREFDFFYKVRRNAECILTEHKSTRRNKM